MPRPSPNKPESSANLDQACRMASRDEGMADLEELLDQLETEAGGPGEMCCVLDPSTDQRLAQRRLGGATGLFVALRYRHAATAAHGLHVALLCSAWAQKMKLGVEERGQIEVASLLHDLGIIGVPDRILYKPTRLESQEVGIMSHARRLGLEILRANGASDAVLVIVQNVPVWYDRPEQDGAPAGSRIPLGSRMIAVAEAFDSMITDHVFRNARSKEAALDELARCAGTQFDPLLVDRFAEIAKQDLSQLYRQLASQWLRDLEFRESRIFGGSVSRSQREDQSRVMARFQAKILDNLRDCVIMVDPAMKVVGWNERTEQLTGIAAESITEQPWRPEIVQMRDEEGRLVLERRCPLQHAVATGMQSAGRFSLSPRNGNRVIVEAQIIPVLDQDCSPLGAALIMRDVSSERSLEDLCKHLHDKATVDPLTKVPNRAEFARVLADLIQKYRKNGSLFSVIICDLDHFKRVNDTYGHQAGDEVLIKTAAVLQDFSRSSDLVARYGGEEFVILCPDCGIAPATRRAEQIRDAISQTEHRMLSGRRATASFGVTQVQAGDTTETILSRADRGLYEAKGQGRNRVIQLGAGHSREDPVRRWAFWQRKKPRSPEILAEEVMLAPGPFHFALEKLRGFVADHEAVLKKGEENVLEFELIAPVYNARRKTDLRHVFIMTLTFFEASPAKENFSEEPGGKVSQIRILVDVALERTPPRIDGELTDYARRMITSLRAYLMATKAGDPGKDKEGQEGKKVLLPKWTAQ